MYGWLWLAWIAAFLAIEIPAAVLNADDSAQHPHTLSAWVWRVIQGQGRWHYAARLGLVAFLAWLAIHFLSGGTIL